MARFPFPPYGRIPNFAGADLAAARLLEIEPWKSATAIKVNPDSPQRPLRAEALRRGITVFVPTPRLRGGFKNLDPRRIPPDKILRPQVCRAATVGQRRWPSRTCRGSMPSSAAPSRSRAMGGAGKGEGYSDLEFSPSCASSVTRRRTDGHRLDPPQLRGP